MGNKEKNVTTSTVFVGFCPNTLVVLHFRMEVDEDEARLLYKKILLQNFRLKKQEETSLKCLNELDWMAGKENC